MSWSVIRMSRQDNVERIVKEGYRFLMCAPVRSYGHLDAARSSRGGRRLRAQYRHARA